MPDMMRNWSRVDGDRANSRTAIKTVCLSAWSAAIQLHRLEEILWTGGQVIPSPRLAGQ